MKKILTITCILFFSAFTFGQEEVQTSSQWQTFISLSEEFTLEVPIRLESQEFGENKKSRRYYNKFENTYFFIFVDTRDKGTLDEVWQYKTVSGFTADYQLNGLKDKSGEYEAEKFEFTDSDGFHQIILFVKTPRYIYTFQTTSQNKHDQLAARFFRSLKINGNSSKLTFDQSEPPGNIESGAVMPKPENKNPQPANAANGGSNSGPSAPSNQVARTQSKALSIVTKVPAKYTDYARFYLIHGTITLRVTFQANGDIGSVSPVNKLPFGLTKTAVEAAKQITFEPAMRNGVPATVVKQVQYTFVLY